MEETFPSRNFRLLNRSLVLSPENNHDHSGPHQTSPVSSSVQNPIHNLPEDLYNLDHSFNNLTLSNQNHHRLTPVAQQQHSPVTQQQHLASHSGGLIAIMNNNRAGVMIGHGGSSGVGGGSSPLTNGYDSVLPINMTYQPDLQHSNILETLKVESILEAELNGGMYTNSQSHVGYPPLPFVHLSSAAGGLNSNTIFTRTDSSSSSSNNNNNNSLINYSRNNGEHEIINCSEFADNYYNTKMPRHNQSCRCCWRQQQGFHFNPLEECKGKIHLVAKDQRGCKFLQKILEIGNPEEFLMIYSEIKDHVIELMKDAFANYLIQKFIVLCRSDQITQLLIRIVSGRYALIEMCQNTHGTRAMQKLIECLTTPEQRILLVSALAYITVPLVKSSNGSHVIHHCLNCLPIQDTKYILNVVAENCLHIATDRSGCCVLQQCIYTCISKAEADCGNRILAEIVSNAFLLSQDRYGNYVVQYAIGKEMPRVTAAIINQLTGRFVSLSMDKHGSHVVEKCMKESSEEEAILIITEIIYDQNFTTVVQDGFGNYVVQTALAVAKGSLRQDMVNLILMNYSSLHNNPHGKRILAKARALKG